MKEREREWLPCVSYGGGEIRQEGEKQSRKKDRQAAQALITRQIGEMEEH